MRLLNNLFENNRKWSDAIQQQRPDFFERLSHQQTPEYLWVGCSDSRVPANEVIGLMPGEVFVHRNVANVVVHTDLNCLSVIQYAVDVLHVKHIIVCGHYGCGGVGAALKGERLGLIENWLRHIEDVRDKHLPSLTKLGTLQAQWDRLCELNVIEQVMHVCRSSVLRDAWNRGQRVTVHGWVYGLNDGLLQGLGVSLENEREADGLYREAVTKIAAALR